MKILALDQSYTCSGIVVFDDGIVVHYSVFKTDKTKDLISKIERAHRIVEYISKIASEFKPDLIAMEGLAYSSVGNATRDLAGLYFMIIDLLLVRKKYKLEIVTPTQVKHFACGKPEKGKKIDKGDMINALPESTRNKFLELGVKKTTGLADLADAYFIGKFVENNIKNKK